MSDMEKKTFESAAHIEAAENLQATMQGKELETLAATAAHNEHDLTPMQAIKAYPMAIFWCLAVSTCVIMEGYDTILIGNFYAYPTFAKKYGQVQAENGTWQLSAAWQAGLGNASGIGAFFGVLLNGLLVDKFGQKRTVIAALISLSCTIFITFFAPNITVLTVGQILSGLPWGVFASSAPAYASEVLPLALRVYFTSYTNMCFIIGQLIAAGVLQGLVSRTDEWGYRIPFALQWMWPAFLIPLLSFAPESPWHLVRQNRLEEAEHSLRRLQRASADIDVKQTLATIVHTNTLEKEISAGTSYMDCFKGTERRRTEIACMVFAGQVLSGSSFAYNSTYFFSQVGVSTDVTYKLNVGGTALALVGTLINWFCLMPYFGRRTIYLWGMAAMSATLMIIGILNVRTQEYTFGITQSSLCIVWTLFFQLSAGQLGWALPAEMGSSRLRQKTICLARNSYYIVSVVAGVLSPYFLNPTAWNMRGYTGFVWGGTAFLTLVWAYFRLPETKDKTFEEIDMCFAQRLPTRQFKHYKGDAFDAEERRKLSVAVDNPNVAMVGVGH